METKIMKIVETELRTDPRTRDSDKFLIWKILVYHGVHIDYEEFMNLPSMETITRCRRKLQEIYPELSSNLNVKQIRNQQMNMFTQINKMIEEPISQTF